MRLLNPNQTITFPGAIIQVSHITNPPKLFKKKRSEGKLKHDNEFRKLEEIFEDRDGDVFDMVLYFSPFHELKTTNI